MWIETEHIIRQANAHRVTSLAEVWIETWVYQPSTTTPFSHFPCGSVDWNTWNVVEHEIELCHFPCGSVDWNLITTSVTFFQFVTSLAEVWIETGLKRKLCWQLLSLPLRKCGLKQVNSWPDYYRLAVTSLVEVWIETITTENRTFANWRHFPCESVDRNINQL